MRTFYVLSQGDGRIKIGVTEDLDRRLEAYKAHALKDIRLLYYITWPTETVKGVESTFKKEWRHRIAYRTEVFYLNDDEVKTALLDISGNYGLPLVHWERINFTLRFTHTTKAFKDLLDVTQVPFYELHLLPDLYAAHYEDRPFIIYCGVRGYSRVMASWERSAVHTEVEALDGYVEKYLRHLFKMV